MTFVLASKNRGKLREMQALLQSLGEEAMLQADAGVDLEVEETGETFEENSLLKAQAVFDATGLPAIADDSGLMVDALDGAPGVHSARFGGAACPDDAARNRLLLEKLQKVPEAARGARFVSVITCLLPDGTKLVARGECPGTILFAPRGEGGFGYDPLFYLPEEGQTFAELSSERKNQISHRALAMQEFGRLLRNYKEHQHADK